ncbi:hypothetical protein RSOLAG1IB_06718 [Rhizoctonia solani AG-1 IB]|uniref:DUF6533 domain-containing protein n=1 Tax=Thanatephorus cucumeris (strain AG1-IB / isolate 7/3/14) TaxID=1108050 RepID=A0A0B7F787_THACB|nr:hypothetical protein RSOLAG1IB_06718 [Rhizoctonia solani AG-1 IB]
MFMLAAHSQLNLHEIELELVHVRASRYLSAAGYVLLLYDHLLTLQDEVKLIWPGPWSLVKILFLINRYSVPLVLTINSWEMSGFTGPNSTTVSTHHMFLIVVYCRRWVPIEGYIEITSLGVSNFLLLLRVHALYGRSRRVLVFLVILYGLTYISILVTATLALVHMIPRLSYSALAGICSVSEKPVTLQAVWAAPLGFEIIIFVMTLHKCLEHAKTQQLQAPILRTLYRDGFLYFLVIVVMRILNLALWIVAPVSLIYLGLYFIWALITLLISRLLLNLRNVSNHTQWSAETDIKGLSIMQFAPRADIDKVPKSKAPVSSTGFTNSTRLTDVMEWSEEEAEDRPDFDPEERRASKRRQQEPDVEVASLDEDMEMGPIRRGTTRHFVVDETRP